MRKLMEFINSLAGVMLAVFFVFVGLDVFTRSVLHSSITWLNEGSTLSFICMALLASAVGFIDDIHYKVSVFPKRFEERIEKLLFVVEMVCVLLFGALLIYEGLGYVEYCSKSFSPALGIRMSYLTAIIPVCGAVIILAVIYRIYLYIKGKPSDKIEKKEDEEA